MNNSLLKRILSLMLTISLVFQLNGITVLADTIEVKDEIIIEAEQNDINLENEGNIINESSIKSNTYNEESGEKQASESKSKDTNNKDEVTELSLFEGVQLVDIGVAEKVINEPFGNNLVYVEVDTPESISSINMYYKNEQDYTEYITLYYNSNTNRFEGRLPTNFNNGYSMNFYLEYMEINYKSNWQMIYRSSLKNTLGIEEDTLDYNVVKRVPKITSINNENKVVYPNLYGYNTLKANIEVENKDITSIRSINLVYGSPYHSWNDNYMYLTYNEETNRFEGESYLYSYNLGINELKSLEISTEWGWINLNKDQVKELFNIPEDELSIEITPYGPLSIKTSQTELLAGDTVKVEMDFSNYPGDISDITLQYNYNYYQELGYWQNEFCIYMKYNEDTGLYEGEYSAGNLSEEGLKSLYSINISDKEGNGGTIYNDSYDSDLNQANFTVKNNINHYIYNMKVNVEKDNLKLGQRTKVSVSGIDSNDINMKITYINLKTNQEKYLPLLYNSKTETWNGYFNLSLYDSNGQWAVKDIYLYEYKENNSSWINIYNRELYKDEKYTKDFTSGDIKAKGTLTDITAPILKSVEIDKEEVQPGDTIILSIDATDDLSGIKKITANFYNNETYHNIRVNDFKYNELTKKYEAQIEIEALDLNGIYRLQNIEIIDNSNNTIQINEKYQLRIYSSDNMDLSAGNFEIINSVDNASDLIKNIELDKEQVSEDNQINISIELTNNSGISSIEARYKFDNNYENSRYIILKYDDKTGKFIGSLRIDSDMVSGEWVMENILIKFQNDTYGSYIGSWQIEDKFGKSSFIINEVEDGYSYIKESNVSSSKAISGEIVKIKVNPASNDGQVERVVVQYISPSGKILDIELDEKTSTFEGEFIVEKFTEPGIWKVNNIKLIDNKNRKNVVYNYDINEENEVNGVLIDLTNLNIEVHGTTLDNTAPELIDIYSDKEIYELGDKIKIIIDAKDDKSGIKSIKANYGMLMIGDEVEPLEFIYNENTRKYECIIDTTKENAYQSNWACDDDRWIINALILEDNVGNVKFVNTWGFGDEEETRKLSDVSFYVFTTDQWGILDLTDKSQAVEGVTAPDSKIEVTVGDKVYTGTSAYNGRFKIDIPKQKGNTVVNIKILNQSGMVITEENKIVFDNTAPDIPIVKTSVTNKTTILEGIAEENSIVVIEKEVKNFGGTKIQEITRTTADNNGNFKVEIPQQAINTFIGIKAIDESGNISDYYTLTVKNDNREDVNNDDLVDILDLALVARKYNILDGDNLWDTNLDVNDDGIIDVFDITMISKKME